MTASSRDGWAPLYTPGSRREIRQPSPGRHGPRPDRPGEVGDGAGVFGVGPAGHADRGGRFREARRPAGRDAEGDAGDCEDTRGSRGRDSPLPDKSGDDHPGQNPPSNTCSTVQGHAAGNVAPAPPPSAAPPRPAVRPTVALRPTEAFKAEVCYLRSTSTPASGERKHWSLMTAWPTSHRGGSKRRFWPCQNLTMVAASVALWAVTRRMPGKGDC